MKLDKLIIATMVMALILGFLYLIKPILAPFIVAIVIAYFLDPITDKLQQYKLSRSNSALIILAVFLLIIAAIFILLVPLFYSQFISLVTAVPGYINIFTEQFYPKIVDYAAKNGIIFEKDLHSYLSDQSFAKVFGTPEQWLVNITQSGIVIVNILSLVFITPVLVFYMIRDWNLLVKKIDHYLPSNYADNIRKIFKEIDLTLSGYIHGQFNVCNILGVFYATGLTLSGLNFGFLIGFLTGFLSFIPYIGMLSGVAVAITVGFFQWGFNVLDLGTVALIFLVGEILEANFLTPKLVGSRVGLHPVWIIFGLFVFGILFGFVGVLLAMPITAICGVLIKFAMLQYKKNFVD